MLEAHRRMLKVLAPCLTVSHVLLLHGTHCDAPKMGVTACLTRRNRRISIGNKRHHETIILRRSVFLFETCLLN